MASSFVNLELLDYNESQHREQLLRLETTCMLNAWSKLDLEQWQQDPYNFTHVACVNGKMIGYINYDLCDRSTCSDHGSLQSYYIYRVAVSPQYRRAGVGRAMVQLVLDQLSHQGVSRVRVAVEDQVVGTGKIKACRFFEGLGFALLGPTKRIDDLNPNTDNEKTVVSFKYTLPGGKIYRNRCAKYFDVSPKNAAE